MAAYGCLSDGAKGRRQREAGRGCMASKGRRTGDKRKSGKGAGNGVGFVKERRDVAAIVLAAGKGSRMESRIQKQYLELEGRPLICHALSAFEKSMVDRVILVAGAGEVGFCQKEIVEAYGFRKVKAVVAGGRERYHSVYEGLKAAEGCEDILIHDGARPCVTAEMINRAIEGAARYGACVVGMPVKDTIKIADSQGNASYTPDRSSLWMIQTPQAFSYNTVREAYDRLFENPSMEQRITDDAMVVETMTQKKVHLMEGSYENIKVTTPEDLEIARVFLKRRREKAIESEG